MKPIKYVFKLDTISTQDRLVKFSVGGTAVFNVNYTVSGANSFDGTSGTVVILANSLSTTVTIIPNKKTFTSKHQSILINIEPDDAYQLEVADCLKNTHIKAVVNLFNRGHVKIKSNSYFCPTFVKLIKANSYILLN